MNNIQQVNYTQLRHNLNHLLQGTRVVHDALGKLVGATIPNFPAFAMAHGYGHHVSSDVGKELFVMNSTLKGGFEDADAQFQAFESLAARTCIITWKGASNKPQQFFGDYHIVPSVVYQLPAAPMFGGEPLSVGGFDLKNTHKWVAIVPI
jgi:hypothetical protein